MTQCVPPQHKSFPYVGLLGPLHSWFIYCSFAISLNTTSPSSFQSTLLFWCPCQCHLFISPWPVCVQLLPMTIYTWPFYDSLRGVILWQPAANYLHIKCFWHERSHVIIQISSPNVPIVITMSHDTTTSSNYRGRTLSCHYNNLTCFRCLNPWSL